MNIFVLLLLFAAGIILIVKGGDWFVDAASWIAEALGIPKFLIGATIVSLATTLPEIIVSVMASLRGSVDMAIGNAIGSVTANTGLILGISIVCIPAVIKRKEFAPKGILMPLAVAAVLAVSFVFGEISVISGAFILLLFVYFIIENIKSAKSGDNKEEKLEIKDKKEVFVNIFKFAAGAVCIMLGADLLVDNGGGIARLMGVPERIISVTLIAIGTSLPELVTTVTAIVKKQSSLSVGNILGANIIDTTFILPVCALVSGKSITVSAVSAQYDFSICLFETLLAVVPTLITKKFSRWQGIAMIISYLAYIVLICFVVK